MNALWKGYKGLNESPDSGRLRRSANGDTYTAIFSGRYDDLVARAPEIGLGYSNAPSSFFAVSDVEIIPGRGGKLAKMSIVCTAEYSGSTNTNSVIGAPVYEVEWVEIDLPLIKNKRYRPGDGGPMELSDDDLEDLGTWEQMGRPPIYRMDGRTVSSGGLSAAAKDYINKFRKGEEVFRAYYPIARRTRTYGKKMETGACGTYVGEGGVPVPDIPSGLIWLKSADRATKTGRHGRWQRIEEWTGLDGLDSQLYDHLDTLNRERFFAWFHRKRRERAS